MALFDLEARLFKPVRHQSAPQGRGGVDLTQAGGVVLAEAEDHFLHPEADSDHGGGLGPRASVPSAVSRHRDFRSGSVEDGLDVRG